MPVMRRDRASATARIIAAATVMRSDLGGAPDGAAAWCERFLSGTWTDRLLLRSTHSRIGRIWWRFLEARAAPGIVSHWMARKRCIDRMVEALAVGGYRQLLVIGAGLDTLIWRMADAGTCSHFIAADHPATLRALRAVAPDCGQVQCVPIDLAHEDPATVLPARATMANIPTVAVIEGLLMYLEPARVLAALRGLALLPVPEMQCIASWMDCPGRPIGFAGQHAAVGAWLRRRGEPMLWGTDEAGLHALLTQAGWESEEVIDLSAADPACAITGLASEKLVRCRTLPRHSN